MCTFVRYGVSCAHTCTYTVYIFFFFNDTATTEIYTLSLHDALPISGDVDLGRPGLARELDALERRGGTGALLDHVLHHRRQLDRKSTRLNSSHANISYAVFCLKKKKK